MSPLLAWTGAARVDRQRDRGPLPVILCRETTVDAAAIGAIIADPRLAVFSISSLDKDWSTLCNRVAVVVIATTSDPLVAFASVITSGVRVPIVVAAQPRYRSRAADLIAAGALALLSLPVKSTEITTMIRRLRVRIADTVLVHPRLRLLVDPLNLRARYQDREVRLTPRECALLHCLARNSRPVAVEELCRYTWPNAALSCSARALPVYVCQLRQKLGRLGLRDAIVTVRCFGYALQCSDDIRSCPASALSPDVRDARPVLRRGWQEKAGKAR